MVESKAAGELVFSIDREGVELQAPADALREIDVDIDVEELELQAREDLPIQLGRRLSHLLGERVEDEEGMFDLLVRRDGTPIASLVVSAGPGDELLNICGTVIPSASGKVVVDAVRQWLGKAKP